jgi:hypothetical protein
MIMRPRGLCHWPLSSRWPATSGRPYFDPCFVVHCHDLAKRYKSKVGRVIFWQALAYVRQLTVYSRATLSLGLPLLRRFHETGLADP